MKVTAAKYIKDYTLEITFSDGSVKRVDLKKFITTSPQPMTAQFSDKKKFKKFSVTFGHLSWGDDMDLSAESLYNWTDES